MAVRKVLLTIALAATSLTASALSEAEWDARFVKGLAMRGYIDLAVKQGEAMVRRNPADQDTRKLKLQLALIYLDIIERGQQTPEEQRELIDKAKCVLKAVEGPPNEEEVEEEDYYDEPEDQDKPAESLDDIDFRVEVAAAKQRIGSILTRQLAKLDDDKRDKLFAEIDKTFKKVKSDFKKIINSHDRSIDGFYNAQPANPAEERRLQEEVDKIVFQGSIYKLREALAYYAHLESYDLRRDDDDREKVRNAAIEKLDSVAWVGQGTSLECYAYYYLGMIYGKEGEYRKATEAFENAINVPGEVQVPEIMARVYLDCANMLIKAGDFEKANEILNAFLSKRKLVGLDGNRPRAMLYKTKALFAWAHDVKTKTPQKAPKVKELYDAAVKMCGQVVEKYPQWQGTANQLIDEWTERIYPEGADVRSPYVLRAMAQRAYDNKEYAKAATLFRKLFGYTTVSEHVRASAGRKLVMCYYRLEKYYDAVAAADFLTLRFNPERFEYAGKALHVAIMGMQERFKKTDDPFDEGLYVEFRKKLGEEKFKLFEADRYKREGDYDAALRTLAAIKPGEGYDMACFLIAECNDLQGDDYFKQRKYAKCIDKQAKAIALYKALLDWSAKNPAEGDAPSAGRRDIEARTMFKLGRLLTGKKKANIEAYYRSAIKSARTADKLAGVIKTAAAALLQPLPDKPPASRARAQAQLQKLADGANRSFLDLTAKVAETHADIAPVLPYIYYLRIMAAVRLDDTDLAEKAIAEIRKYPEFGEQIGAGSVYGRVAEMFDSRARDLEEQAKPEESKQAYAKAVEYYRGMIEADPDQSLQMFHYVILLMQKHASDISIETKLGFVDAFMKKFGDEHGDKNKEKVDHIRLVLAELLFEKGDLRNAVKAYADLVEKLDKDYQAKKAEDPNHKMTPQHWAAKLGLAKARKALGDYQGAIGEFNTIRKKVREGGETWWMATYHLVDCMVELKEYDVAVKKLRTIHATRPSMGGPAMRNDFLKLLAKVINATHDQRAQELIRNIQNSNKETE